MPRRRSTATCSGWPKSWEPCITCAAFAARWIANEPVLNHELDDFKWLPPNALGDLKLTGGLPEVIQSARRLVGI